MKTDPDRHYGKDKLSNLPSRTISVCKARLKVGAFDKSVSVNPDSRSVSFDVPLKKGLYKLQSWLYDKQKQPTGAYYITIKKTISNAGNDYKKYEKDKDSQIQSQIHLFPMIQMMCQTKKGNKFEIYSIGSGNKFMVFSDF